MAALKTPRDGATCGWYNVLRPGSDVKMLKGDATSDWVVLGAGVTGLSAAHRLAEHAPQSRIALVEAGRIGNGTSGRNSGFVMHCNVKVDDGSGDAFQREARLNAYGAQRLQRLIRSYQIACDWHDFGMLWAGAGKQGDIGVREKAHIFLSLGQQPTCYDRTYMKHLTGSDFYTSGVSAPGTALMQPAAMCYGLARTLANNVQIYEQTPVVEIERTSPIRVHSEHGSIITKGLILCTNSFTPALGFGRNRIIPGSVFASLTRTLSEEELAQVGGQGPWGILPSVIGGATVRRTNDNRILMRNGSGYLPRKWIPEQTLKKMQVEHYASIARRWPNLDHVEIIDTWGGVCGATRNHGQYFGELAPRIWGAFPCNGANISRGAATGEALVDFILGAESSILADHLATPKPAWVPPEPLLGLVAYRRWQSIVSRGSEER